jgi:hypothetical protein
MPGRTPAARPTGCCLSRLRPPAWSRRRRSAARLMMRNGRGSTITTAGRSSVRTRFEASGAALPHPGPRRWPPSSGRRGSRGGKRATGRHPHDRRGLRLRERLHGAPTQRRYAADGDLQWHFASDLCNGKAQSYQCLRFDAK